MAKMTSAGRLTGRTGEKDSSTGDPETLMKLHSLAIQGKKVVEATRLHPADNGLLDGCHVHASLVRGPTLAQECRGTRREQEPANKHPPLSA